MQPTSIQVCHLTDVDGTNEGDQPASRRIPPELISEIVKQAFRPGLVLNRKERLDFMQYRRVSRLWRETPLSDQSFWRGLVMPFQDPTRLPRVEALEAWFDRGGKDAPLVIVADESSIATLDRPALTIIQYVIAFGGPNRIWKEVRLPLVERRFTDDTNCGLADYIDAYLFQSITAAIDSEFRGLATYSKWHMLETLKLTGDLMPFTFCSADSDSDQAFSKLLPGLRNLTLFWAWHNSQTVFIFHTGVTSLTVHLSYPYYGSGVQLFGQFPNVKELTINPFPLVCSNAILAEGWDDDEDDDESLVPFITAPNLRHMSFKHFPLAPPAGDVCEDQVAFIAHKFLSPSPDKRPLESLSLEGKGLSVSTSGRLLAKAETIKKLFVLDDWWDWYVSKFPTVELPVSVEAIYHPMFDASVCTEILIPFFSRKCKVVKEEIEHGTGDVGVSEGHCQGTLLWLVFDKGPDFSTAYCDEQQLLMDLGEIYADSEAKTLGSFALDAYP
ncbi:hypothetical protein FA15DRAFT_702446 [Coprinopsis marcescibilis]|uniref:F-box domain-containing protein n=1 Tax=Coprinopsis marcescibilis TaxID=230819 RepID=A0A5C3L2V4_COPMA|nr:hypothetical protein FA15DRAFT_702446 [Coprinopsis marcescibilis]